MPETEAEPPRVLLLDGIHAEAARKFGEAGFQVEALTGTLPEEELARRVEGVTVLGVRSRTPVPRAVVERAAALEAVGAFCAGTSHIDADACLERGIPVFNAPYSNTRSVVELTLGLMIMLLRGIPEKNALMHRGTWRKSAAGANEIRGKVLGIVGYGNIGAQLSVLAEALGMEVCFHDVMDKLPMGNARPCRTLRELLERSDVVSVHVAGGPSSRRLLGRDELAAMKKGAVLVNVSRGSVVDQEALKEALETGHLRGAALDVFPEEPRGKDEPFDSLFRGMDNVLLTPHIGGSTEEAQAGIGAFVPDKILAYLNQGSTNFSVNFPNLRLPELGGMHRLVHIHANVPGILARINQVLADQGINIAGQHLKTNARIGYVITDVARDYDRSVVRELEEIPRTIKVRVLY